MRNIEITIVYLVMFEAFYNASGKCIRSCFDKYATEEEAQQIIHELQAKTIDDDITYRFWIETSVLEDMKKRSMTLPKLYGVMYRESNLLTNMSFQTVHEAYTTRERAEETMRLLEKYKNDSSSDFEYKFWIEEGTLEELQERK